MAPFVFSFVFSNLKSTPFHADTLISFCPFLPFPLTMSKLRFSASVTEGCMRLLSDYESSSLKTCEAIP